MDKSRIRPLVFLVRTSIENLFQKNDFYIVNSCLPKSSSWIRKRFSKSFSPLTQGKEPLETASWRSSRNCCEQCLAQIFAKSFPYPQNVLRQMTIDDRKVLFFNGNNPSNFYREKQEAGPKFFSFRLLVSL